MNIRYLKSSKETPLLPPGMELEANQGNDPVADGAERLMASFQTWLTERNYGLAEMTNKEIYQRLRNLGGQSHNPLTCEQVYQKLLGMRQVHPQGNQAPLLPIDVEF